MWTTTGNHQGNITHKMAISTKEAVQEESHDTNNASSTIDSKVTSQESLQEQEKPSEQATTQSNKQIQAGQQPNEHTAVQHGGTQVLSSSTVDQSDNTTNHTRLIKLLPKEW